MYYDGKLEPDESVYQRRELSENLSSFWPQGQGSAFPLMFCDIVGEEEDYRTSAVFKGSVDSHSKSNLEEANKTVGKAVVCLFMNCFIYPCRWKLLNVLLKNTTYTTKI